jgi:hypothetical protein
VQEKLRKLEEVYRYCQAAPSFPHTSEYNPFTIIKQTVSLDAPVQKPLPRIPLTELREFISRIGHCAIWLSSSCSSNSGSVRRRSVIWYSVKSIFETTTSSVIIGCLTDAQMRCTSPMTDMETNPVVPESYHSVRKYRMFSLIADRPTDWVFVSPSVSERDRRVSFDRPLARTGRWRDGRSSGRMYPHD